MSAKEDSYYADWNPWHGCTKISPGCKYCYVYRQDEMYGATVASSVCRKTAAFDLPARRRRDGGMRIPPGKVVFTCFTSDFLLADADEWREDCWRMMRERPDCLFYFFTKRILRFRECMPSDWGEGYDNVIIGCTVEDQKRADERLGEFLSLPIKHRAIIASPLLEQIDISRYLTPAVSEVSVGGESGREARPCDHRWVMSLREQCARAGVAFRFHQTGAKYIKDGKLYRVARGHQLSQARRAGLDLGEVKYYFPEAFEKDKYVQLSLFK